MVLTLTECMKGIDVGLLESLPMRHRRSKTQNHGRMKYCRWQDSMPEAMNRANDHGLEGKRPVRILDIGCGFGYFVRCCNVLGHDAMGLEVDDALAREACLILQAPTVHQPLVAQQGLPQRLTSFDLITLYRVEAYGWMLNDYAYLMRDLIKRLAYGGELFVDPNYGRVRERIMQRKWWRQFVDSAVVGKQRCHGISIQIGKA